MAQVFLRARGQRFLSHGLWIVEALELTGLSLWVWPWGFCLAHVSSPVAYLTVRRFLASHEHTFTIFLQIHDTRQQNSRTLQSMKSLLACVLAIAVALAALTVAIGYFRQSRKLQAQLAATTKELQQTKSDLERAKREAGLSYPFH